MILRITIVVIFLFMSAPALFGQHTFRAVISDRESGDVLPGAGAVVQGTMLGATADENGVVEIDDIPDGRYSLVFSFIGYEKRVIEFTFPDDAGDTMEILLEAGHESLEAVVIASTRSSRTIADIPTRVELIAGEELEEKGNMKPGDIRMLLNESTGIQTQQTSATSANASIRIQGLDGRYTQILKDGFPLYAGFSGGLGLLQTPPLDLKQVEVIKGSTSTLYGGGAIAGLVNLVSRVPTEERELRFMANATSALGLDLSTFYSEKFGKAGVTVFAARNSSEPYDPADIGLTAIPKFERYTINPRLYLDLTDNTSVNVGFNFITEDRIGGDIRFIEGTGDGSNAWFEQNDSRRFSTRFSFHHHIDEKRSLNVKNSLSHFDRIVEIPGYRFDGIQNSTYTELNYIDNKEEVEWIAGLNLWTDNFTEQRLTATPLRDYNQTTFGAFVQNNLVLSDKVNLETGLRGDYVVDYGFVLLPRVSLLFKASPSVTTRLGGGFGYKTPTIFTEESERIQYQNVLPASPETNKLERSYGANWDINYRTEVPGDVGFSVNHLFFYTYLNDPLVLEALDDTHYQFVSLDGFMDSKGMETNVKLEYGDFKLFIGYTFTDTKIHNDGTTVQNPLTAKHRLNNVLMYEVEEKWKIGLEGYYFGRQRLNDGTYGREYWICGLMMEKLWEQFSLFLNFENFLDTRQTRFDRIYTGPISNPVFRDIYAPVDGFVVNGGVKLFLSHK